MEAAKTPEGQQRISLVKLLRRLSDNQRPLDRPNTLVRAAARSYAERQPSGATTFTTNVDPDLDGVWVALNDPEVIDDDARLEIVTWAKEWGDEYDRIVYGGRDRFQALIAKYRDARRPSVADTFRSYLRNVDQIFTSLVAPIYQRETGQTLSREEFDEMMREPIWPLYLGGYAYALHQRAVQVNDYSRTRNAGGIDLGQAVYLRLCDTFVTNDRAQYRALRFLNRFARASNLGAEVLPYGHFRRRLLPFG